MTKGAALHEFFSGFGITSYPSSSVPEDKEFPWLTYDLVTDAWEGGEVSITVNLWYLTESEAVPNAKVVEISKAIGLGGIQIPCDGGTIWLKRGQPWCQSLSDDTDTRIKRRYINISAEYNTLD